MGPEKQPLASSPAGREDADDTVVDNMFSDRLPGAADDEEEMAPIADHDSNDADDDQDDDSSLEPSSGHVYGKNSRLHHFLPEKGYVVFSLAVLFCIAMYIAVPIVCLSTSYLQVEQRESLLAQVAAQSAWTQRLLRLDQLQTRLATYALLGDGLVLDSVRVSDPVVASTLSSDGSAMATYSVAAKAVLDEARAVFADVNATLAYITARPTLATYFLTASFQSTIAEASEFILNKFFVRVTQLFALRTASRHLWSSMYSTLFSSVFSADYATAVSSAMSFASEARIACASTTTCASTAGMTLADTILSNVTSAVYRSIAASVRMVQYIDVIKRANVQADSLKSSILNLQTFVGQQQVELAASIGLFNATKAQIERLGVLQSSSTGGAINTSALAPTAAEASLVAMLPPNWASTLVATTALSMAMTKSALAALTADATTKITAILTQYALHGEGLLTRPVEPLALFDSGFTLDFDSESSPPTTLEQQEKAQAFRDNALNAFFTTMRTTYRYVMDETTEAAQAALATNEANSVGLLNVQRIQATVSVCSILPAFALWYLLHGVSVRLPSSPFPYRYLLFWILVSYGIFIAATSSIAMVAINQLRRDPAIESSDIAALSRTNNAAMLTSGALRDAMSTFLLVQPNVSTAVAVFQQASTSIATIVRRNLDAPYATNVQALVANLTAPVVDLRLQPLREALTDTFAFSADARVIMTEAPSASAFDALPSCNKSRMTSALVLLLDSFAASSALYDTALGVASSFASRTEYPVVAASNAAFCGSCSTTDIPCVLPSPLGFMNHPDAHVAYLPYYFSVNRTGTAITYWQSIMTDAVRYVASRADSTTSLVGADLSEWVAQRRLIVWISVFGVLLLQGVWYIVWRMTFEQTLHANLLP